MLFGKDNLITYIILFDIRFSSNGFPSFLGNVRIKSQNILAWIPSTLFICTGQIKTHTTYFIIEALTVLMSLV